MTISLNDARLFAGRCKAIGVAVPEPLERALHLLQVAQRHAIKPAGSLLQLADDEARDWITVSSIRAHEGYNGASRGMEPGINDFRTRLLAEVQETILPDLERIVIELRPRFDEAVAPLVLAAQEFGFTFGTRPEDVLDMTEPGAVEAFRGARDAWAAVQPLAKFRIIMARAFGHSPTPDDAAMALGAMDVKPDRLSYSVLFAAGQNFAYDETYNILRRPGEQLDWLALAVGGLNYNTPTEVDEKIRAR